jgi:hypothetical protein
MLTPSACTCPLPHTHARARTREERVQKSGLLGGARAANPQLRAVEALLAAAAPDDPFCLYLRALAAIDRCAAGGAQPLGRR